MLKKLQQLQYLSRTVEETSPTLTSFPNVCVRLRNENWMNNIRF